MELESPFNVPEEFKPRRYRSTVVSLLPWKPYPEEKPHLIPSVYPIPARNEKTGIGILHVGEGSYIIPDPFSDRNNRVTVSPDDIAKSIVNDYVSGQMALGEDACPGLFWLEGELSEKDVLKHFKNLVDEYTRKQKNWFRQLVNMADTDFTKNRNRMSISDIQIMAAKDLGYKADWVDFADNIQQMGQCPFCKSSIPEGAIKCQVCNEIVDAAAYKKIKGEMANG